MTPLDGSYERGFWKDAQALREAYEREGSMPALALRAGVSTRTLLEWWKRHSLPQLPKGPKPDFVEATTDTDEWLLAALRKAGDEATVEELANAADVSPRRVREALDRLGTAGYRVREEAAAVRLERVVPDKHNLHPNLLLGSEARFGVVSDTHLGSEEEALSELELAYDFFEAEGIETVLHAGDFICGRGIFRGQDSEIKVHTLDQQIDYLVEHYPRREGIRTFGIAGNHDLEGEAGRAGLDPVAAFAYRRDDIDYLGAYSAWLQVGDGPWIHLLHGKGGMGYAYSYKAQKLVDGYPAGRKPALLICGHWHVRANFEARGVQVMFPGCFEWQSRFLTRLGLSPAVGFHIVDLTFGDDGSVVQFLPRWLRFWEGRVVG